MTLEERRLQNVAMLRRVLEPRGFTATNKPGSQYFEMIRHVNDELYLVAWALLPDHWNCIEGVSLNIAENSEESIHLILTEDEDTLAKVVDAAIAFWESINLMRNEGFSERGAQ